MRDVGPLMYATVRDDTHYSTMTRTNSPHAFEPSSYFRFASEFSDINSETERPPPDNQGTHESSHEPSRLMTAVQRRKNSIEMFLSQSPSQVLGTGFLKMSLEDEEKGLETRANVDQTLELEREPTPEHHLREDEWGPESLLYYEDSLQQQSPHQEGYFEHSTSSTHSSSSSWSNMPVSRPYNPTLPQYTPSVPRLNPYTSQLRPTMRTSPISTNRYPMYPSSTNMIMERSPSPLYTNTSSSLTMMKPCKFYLQGHCRMGNKCKFIHHVPSQSSVYGYSHETPYTMRIEEPFESRVASPLVSSTYSLVETNVGSEPIIQLETIRHRVFSMSKDQNGCRLLQEQLDLYEERKELCDIIYMEAMEHLAEMMVDPFGNYLFQKLLERAKPLQKLDMIRTVSHHLVAAALNLHGTRSVQKLVEVCSISSEVVELDSDGHEARRIKLAQLIVNALKDDAVRLCIDSNGNHVIQRTLQYMNSEETQFVFDAVANECLTVGTHRHGCCVLQRCLDAANPIQKRQVIAQVEKQAMKLMQDPYGNYVVQYVLDSCTPTEALGVMMKPLGHLFELSIQKFSSNVIEKCLEKAPTNVLSCYVEELISYSSMKMQKMLQDQFANYVVQRAICVAMETQCMTLVQSIRPHLTTMKNTSGGRRITARILKRFPHLDLHLEGFHELHENEMIVRGSNHRSIRSGNAVFHGTFGPLGSN